MSTLAPLNIYINKKTIRKKIILYIAGFFFFIMCFLIGITPCYPGDGPDPRIVFMLLGAIFMIVLIIRQIIVYNKKTPLVTIDQFGIQVFEPPLHELGLVRWADITGCSELALDSNRRELILYVKDPSVYVSKIKRKRKHRKYMEAFKNHNQGLLWIETSRLNYDRTLFKTMITDNILKVMA